MKTLKEHNEEYGKERLGPPTGVMCNVCEDELVFYFREQPVHQMRVPVWCFVCEKTYQMENPKYDGSEMLLERRD